MALADYRLCDICGNKTFYDANLNYDFDDPELKGKDWPLVGLGDWVVICKECAKTHVCVVKKRET